MRLPACLRAVRLHLAGEVPRDHRARRHVSPTAPPHAPGQPLWDRQVVHHRHGPGRIQPLHSAGHEHTRHLHVDDAE